MDYQQQEAIAELRELKEKIDALAGEAEELVRENFPNEMNWCDSYGIFRMTSSGNPYDSTFEKLIENLETEE